LTLVYQIDLDVTRLLWVGRERTIESFRGFFTVIGDELASKIVFVCSDMWEPYLKVIREKAQKRDLTWTRRQERLAGCATPRAPGA
jgi:transposase